MEVTMAIGSMYNSVHTWASGTLTQNPKEPYQELKEPLETPIQNLMQTKTLEPTQTEPFDQAEHLQSPYKNP